ncbi:uncharacterized protein VTP21DRAFT_6944 [Calcarisporiella thermophila]|uniref:uncharacterized protein n=1 Tax=Calcarisporiella thermophila TaxID=911321 RepID=UPI0037449B16
MFKKSQRQVARTVLDEEARRRSVQRRLAELERDNFTEADISFTAPAISIPPRKISLHPDDTKTKRRPTKEIRRLLLVKKNLNTLIEESRIDLLPPEVPTYLTADAAPSMYPPRRFCSVCGYIGNYSCTRCGMRYCTLKCLATHEETRCMKVTL